MMDWFGPILHEYYSSTEANGITMVDPDEWSAKPGTVGTAKLGTIHICDDDGAEHLLAGDLRGRVDIVDERRGEEGTACQIVTGVAVLGVAVVIVRVIARCAT